MSCSILIEKLLEKIIYGRLYPKSDADRLYVPRNLVGGSLISIQVHLIFIVYIIFIAVMKG